MIRRTAWILALTMALAVPAFAQAPRIEVTANFGWVFSDGVTGDGIIAGDGNVYNEILLTDSGTFAVTFGVLATEGAEIGFQFSRQFSELQVKGTATSTVGSMAVDGYHGYFAYNFGAFDSPLRPYVMLGLGATHYDGVDFTSSLGEQRSTPGGTQFSTTLGAGVKVYPAANFGVKLGARWTPTFIKSDAAGWWCDPWYGCYVVGDAQYSNQFEFVGGLVLRF